MVALPGSTEPDVVTFLDGLGLRPGVEVEVREKHPFDGPLVLRVGGHDRTIGERVARQILVRDHIREAEPAARDQQRREQSLIHVLAAEGGYQPSTWTAPSGCGCSSPPLSALFAIGSGLLS